jgi:hypothetical protein
MNLSSSTSGSARRRWTLIKHPRSPWNIAPLGSREDWDPDLTVVDVMPVEDAVSLEDYTRTVAEWSQRCAEETREARRLREVVESHAAQCDAGQTEIARHVKWRHAFNEGWKRDHAMHERLREAAQALIDDWKLNALGDADGWAQMDALEAALAPATTTEGTTMTTYVGLVQRGEILQQRIVADGSDRAAVEKAAQTRAAELNAGQEPDGFELAWKAATLPRKS